MSSKISLANKVPPKDDARSLDEMLSDEEETKSDGSEDENQNEDLPDELLLDEKGSGDEEEYEPIEASSGEDEGEKSEEEEPDEEEEILNDLPDEDEELADEDPIPEEDAPDLEEHEQIFEDTRKKKAPPKRKEARRKLFPFIQKKRRAAQAEARDAPEFYSLEVRGSARGWMETSLGVESKEVIIFEKAIFNAAARQAGEINSDMESDSVQFKTLYVEIVRYFMGAWTTLKKSEILAELRGDKHSSESVLFDKAREEERKEQDKIKNPMDVQEDANYPCPRCKGIKTFRQRINDRGGDEATSLRLWCHDRACGFSWRLAG